MASTGLKGPFLLTSEKIDEEVTEISPGTYVLGHLNDEDVFIVKYVGRSDEDLNDRLHDWIDEYKRFKFGYFNSEKEAFEKECIIYHDFGESESLDNEIHPDRPDNTDWECPSCAIFD